MRKSKRTSIRRRAGFTLVEVLLVVAILGILAAVVVVNLGGKQQGAMIKATRGTIANVSTAVDLFEVDVGRYPSSLNELVSNPGAPSWKGPYVRGGVGALVDAWGTPLAFVLKGESDYEIRSAGPDRQTGSADDITSFTNE